MSALQHAIHRTRRRMFVQAWLDITGVLASLGLIVAMGLLLLTRALAIPVPWQAYIGLAALVGLAAPLIAWTRQPDAAHAAAHVDRQLKLKDKLATALYAQQLDQADVFTQQVLAEGTQVASQARLHEATPIGFTRSWLKTITLGGIVALIAWLMPSDLDLLGLQKQRAQQQQTQANAHAVEQQIIEAKTLMQQANTQDTTREEADPDSMLKALASLTQRDLSTPEAQQDAAAQLSDLKEKLAKQQKTQRQAFRSVQNAMTQLDAGGPGPVDRFANALRRGDFDAAQRAIQTLADQSKNLSKAEQQAAAKQLQNIANQLKQLQPQLAKQQAQTQQQIQQQLQQQGLSTPQIQQLQQQGYPPQAVQQALQQRYQQQGMSPHQAQKQAQQQAQQIQQQQQQSQDAGQSSRFANSMSQSMQQMAQGMQQGGQPGQSQSQQGAFSAGQQLQQIQQMQNQLNQMQQAQQQMQQAINNISQSGGQGQGPGQGQQPGQGAGAGGQPAGTGEGGNPLGAGRQAGSFNTHTRYDLQEGQGRVITSWTADGQAARGESHVRFDQTITQARTAAERAVTDDRVPRRYHQAIREYFKQLPDSTDQIKHAPAAPR